MKAYIVLKSLQPMSEKPAIFSVGGYSATSADGREFSFDFEEASNAFTIDEEGKGVFTSTCSNRDIEVYIDQNLESGVEDSEITAEFIASSSLVEVFYECYLTAEDEVNAKMAELKVVSFEILDNDDTVGKFSEEELERFNKEVAGV